jgi:hypothetical protein
MSLSKRHSSMRINLLCLAMQSKRGNAGLSRTEDKVSFFATGAVRCLYTDGS